MAIVARQYNFSAGGTAVADQVDTDFNTIYSEFNGNISSTNLAASAVTDSKMDVSVRQSTSRNETGIGNFVYSGVLGSTSANLVLTISAGTAYVLGYRLAISQTQQNLTASKDTYIDLDSTGAFTYIPVSNGASAPSVTANSIRIGKAVTNATAITSYSDLANRSNAQAPAKSRVFGAEVRYASTTTIKVLPGIVEISGTNYTNTTSTVVTVTGNGAWLTGSAAASTHVYVYAKANSAGTFDVQLSSIAPNKTDTAGNANGIKHYLLNASTYYRFLGYCRLDGSVLNVFYSLVTESDIEYLLADGVKNGVTAAAQTTWTALSLVSHVPALDDVEALLECRTITSGGAEQKFFFRRTGSALATGRYVSTGVADNSYNELWVELNSSQSCDYRFSAANSHSIKLTGWRANR